MINFWETEYHVVSILLSFAALRINPNFSGLKPQQTFIIEHVSVGQELDSSLDGWLWLRVFHEATVKVSTGN